MTPLKLRVLGWCEDSYTVICYFLCLPVDWLGVFIQPSSLAATASSDNRLVAVPCQVTDIYKECLYVCFRIYLILFPWLNKV